MRSGFLALCLSGLALGLASCNRPAPVGDPTTGALTSEEAPAPAKRPVIVEAGVNVVLEIAKAGKPWDEATISDTNHYTGGTIQLYRRTAIMPDAVVVVDRTEDGGVSYVRAQAGASDRCSSPGAVGAAYVQLQRALELDLPDAATLARLKSDWSAKSDKIDQFEVGRIQFTASGGCRPAIALKAIGP